MFNQAFRLPLGYTDETSTYLDLLLEVPFELFNLLEESLLAPGQL
jgi:hypothetical protein